LSFLGAKFSEARLIGMAYAFEQKTKVRDKVQPHIVPSTEIQDVLGEEKTRAVKLLLSQPVMR
jgi:amidase